MRKFRASIILLSLGVIVFLVSGLLPGSAGRAEPLSLSLPLESLKPSPGLPEILLLQNGHKVRSESDWKKRREEMKSLLLYYQYGSMPPRPDEVSVESTRQKVHPSGTGFENWMTLVIGSERKLRMRMVLYLPNVGSGPYPVVIREEGTLGRTQAIPLFLKNGYAFIEYARHDLDPDKNNIFGPAQLAYPEHDWATLAVWAWGGMRVVDYLESRDDIDMNKIAITGHSRGGKMALLAGALDERFALVVPNGSGAGGAGASRVLGPGAESIGMNDKPHWYHERIQWFGGNEDHLPFDQHFLKALIAPRLLLCTESLDDLYANPWGTQVTSMAANQAYQFLESDTSRNGLVYRRGKHDSNMEDWQNLLDFSQWHFNGIPPQNKSRFWMTPMAVPAGLLSDSHNPHKISSAPGSPALIDEGRLEKPLEIAFSRIGSPGNEEDKNHFMMGRYGGVEHPFMISTGKISVGQYAQFLNTIAADDPSGIYHAGMSEAGLIRLGKQGQYRYSHSIRDSNAPITCVSFFNAARFCNWLHNGQPDGAQGPSTTEDGAYLIDVTGHKIQKRGDARYFLPSEDQWYKAAYYDPASGYRLYVNGTRPSPVGGDGSDGVSPFGVSGMNDGIWEWNEAIIGGLFRGLRSGAWFQGNNRQAAGRNFTNPSAELTNIGFRIAQ